jgi:glutathione S-transferase
VKLFYSPFHGFIHKTLVVLHESGLWERTEFVPTYPYRNRAGEFQGQRYSIAALNPLDKVPTLALDDGSILFGSQVIVEYLDASGTRRERLFPVESPARWRALTLMALADTMFECTVALSIEGWQPPESRRLPLYERNWPKLIHGLDRLEQEAATGFAGLDVGQVAMLQAISYLDERSKGSGREDPLHPGFDWTAGRPRLHEWWLATIGIASVRSHYGIDYAGDDSAAHCQRHVQEVLVAREERR